jgi:hypothetical protein
LANGKKEGQCENQLDNLPAVPARPVQRQVYRQNPTYSEHFTEQELRPQLGRELTGGFGRANGAKPTFTKVVGNEPAGLF